MKTKTWTVTMQVVTPAGMKEDMIVALVEEALDASSDIGRRNLDITQVRANEG